MGKRIAWRRGMFRLWIVFSLAWCTLTFGIGWSSLWVDTPSPAELRCSNLTRVDCSLEILSAARPDLKPGAAAFSRAAAYRLGLVVTLPPAATLITGALIFWIIAGFSHRMGS